MRAASLPPAAESLQSRLATALLDPAAPAPPRFEVHRNSVVSSLVRALAEGFPSVERLVGEAFFRAMAAAFVRARPPSHPVLLAYGANFPAFLESFAPVATLPYLADVARLDGLRRRAWHAADVPALGLESFAGVDAERAGERRIALHPSVGLLCSPHPAHALWTAQNGDGTSTPFEWRAETALVWRRDGAIHAAVVDRALLDLLDAARRAPTLSALLATDCDAEAQARARAFADALQRGLLVDANALELAHAAAPDAALFDDFLPPFPNAPSIENPP
jgi:hypothetical protein